MKSLIKIFINTVTLLGITSVSFATNNAFPVYKSDITKTAPGDEDISHGGSNGGGGDPLANDFIRVARIVHQKIHSADAQFRAAEFLQKIDELDGSLEGRSPKIILPPGDTVNCFNEPKLGCFSDGKMRIARDGWKKASAVEKVEVTAMEIYMSMAQSRRYELGKSISDSFTVAELDRVSSTRLNGVADIDGSSDYTSSVEFKNIPVGTVISINRDLPIYANTSKLKLGEKKIAIRQRSKLHSWQCERAQAASDANELGGNCSEFYDLQMECNLTYNPEGIARVVAAGTRLSVMNQIEVPWAWGGQGLVLKDINGGSTIILECLVNSMKELHETKNAFVEILSSMGISMKFPTPKRF